jgi:CRP-like cAMP-binding protein
MTKMLDIFRTLTNANQLRNSALSLNLKKSEDRFSKLHKLVFPALVATTIKEGALNLDFVAGSKFRMWWDSFALCCMGYYLVSIPYRAVFLVEYNAVDIYLRSPVFVDFCVDLYFILDMVVRSRLATQPALREEDQEEVTDLWAGGMVAACDVIASVPLELLSFVPTIGFRNIFILRGFHLLRLRRCGYALETSDRLLASYELRLTSSATLLLRMCILFVLLNHLGGCVWFALHRFEASNSSQTWASTSKWPISYFDELTNAMSICDNGESGASFVSTADCFLRSYYVITNVFSNFGLLDSYPTNNIETIWGICVSLIACILAASVVGAWQAFLKQLDKTGDSSFKEKIKDITNYMEYRQFQPGLRNAIILHYTHIWHSTKCIDEALILDDLPDPLRIEIAHSIIGQSFSKFPVLHERLSLTKKRLAGSMRKQIAAADSIIYEVGDTGWEIYFIASGIVKIQLLQPDHPQRVSNNSSLSSIRVSQVTDPEQNSTLWMAHRRSQVFGEAYREGNHFGEGCLTSASGLRIEDATALSMSELFTLSKTKFAKDVLAFMPASQRHDFITNLITRNGCCLHTTPNEAQRRSSKKFEMQVEIHAEEQKKRRMCWLCLLEQPSKLTFFCSFVRFRDIPTPGLPGLPA